MGTEERFALQILDKDGSIASDEPGKIAYATVTYEFSFYRCVFVLDKASQYSVVIQLTKSGGLKGKYYETTNFEALVANVETYDHTTTQSYYTQIDEQIDFDLG